MLFFLRRKNVLAVTSSPIWYVRVPKTSLSHFHASPSLACLCSLLWTEAAAIFELGPLRHYTVGHGHLRPGGRGINWVPCHAASTVGLWSGAYRRRGNGEPSELATRSYSLLPPPGLCQARSSAELNTSRVPSCWDRSHLRHPLDAARTALGHHVVTVRQGAAAKVGGTELCHFCRPIRR